MALNGKVLYIEDSVMNFRLVKKHLHHNGYQVTHAVNGKRGIAAARHEQPRLILLDINLPDIDGIEVARTLKADITTNNIPIVAITANTMVGDREAYLNAGCDGYVAKPITRLELMRTIEQVLSVQSG